MNKILGAALAAASAGIAVPAHAQSADARNFGAREAAWQVTISPDGNKIAMVGAAPGAAASLMVASLDGNGTLKPIMTSSGRPDRLHYCHWSTNNRLICQLSLIAKDDAHPDVFTRMIAVDADGTHAQLLSAKAGSLELGATYYGGGVIDYLPDEAGSAVLTTRNFVEEVSTGHVVARATGGLGVERVDTESLKRVIVEQPRETAASYISDGHGTVRVYGVQPVAGTGYSTKRLSFFYRVPGSRDWKPLSTVALEAQSFSGFWPEAVDRDLNVVYGYDALNGHKALYSISLDGNLTRTLIYARDDVDVGDLIRLGRQQRVVGVSWSTDKSHIAYFDKQLDALHLQLARALPGNPQVSIVDASADENRLVLFAGSDRDPGRFYLFDRKAKKLSEIQPVRPDLANTQLAEMKPVSYSADDGTTIPAYLTVPAGSDGKNLPMIVMPHGGPGSRDEWGFDWLPQFFAARGYAVLQPNFRGSTGYGEAWFQKNGFQSWRIAIGDINAGARWAVKQGIAAPGKLAIFGWSYGGYAALQSSVLDSDLYKAIVAVAPVTDLETLRSEGIGYTDYRIQSDFIGRGPHVTEGSPAQNVERIKAPVLLFHGDRDMNVGVRESRLMASRLKGAGKQVDYVEFSGLDHQLEDSQARTQMLDKSDGFIRAALGLPAKP